MNVIKQIMNENGYNEEMLKPKKPKLTTIHEEKGKGKGK
jgi:hypothetical protein